MLHSCCVTYLVLLTNNGPHQITDISHIDTYKSNALEPIYSPRPLWRPTFRPPRKCGKQQREYQHEHPVSCEYFRRYRNRVNGSSNTHHCKRIEKIRANEVTER